MVWILMILLVVRAGNEDISHLISASEAGMSISTPVSISAMSPTVQVTTIRGQVSSSEGDPLPGAYVFLEGVPRGTSTDLDGNFSLTVAIDQNSILIVSMIGYRRLALRIDELGDLSQPLSISLTSITVTSGEVVITAGRRSQITGSVPMSVRSIDAREIESRNVVTLDQSLRYVPGVQIAQNQVNVRGSTGFSYGTGSRVLLLVDGVPLMGPDSNDIRFSALPMSEVRKIEVIKGPGSSLYGSGALGGVINLITKDFSDVSLSTIRAFSGFHEPVTYDVWRENWDGADDWRMYSGVSVTHSMALNDRLGFWINGLYRSDQGYLENTNGYSFQGYSKIGYKVTSNINLDLYLGFRQARQRTFLYWNGIDDPLRTGRISLGTVEANGRTYTEGQQYNVLPTLRHVVSDKFFYNIRGRAYGIVAKPLNSEGNYQDEEKFTRGLRYGGEAEFTWTPTNTMVFVTGASADAIAADSEIFIGVDNKKLRNQPEYAVFGQLEFIPVRRLNVSAGVRYDAYEIDTQDIASKVSPKFNLAFTPNEALTIRTAYGHGFRVPSISERFVNNSDYLPLLPNLGLRPEESVGYEMGTRYVHRFNNIIDLEVDVVLFQNDYKGLIEPRFLPQFGAFRFLNLTEARIRGFETTVDLREVSGVGGLMLGYTYLDHEDKATGEPLTYRSTHQINLSLSLNVPDVADFGLDYRFLSKPERIDTDFSLFVPNSDEFVDIHVVDFRIAKTLQLGTSGNRMTVSGAIKNVLNYYYVERPAYLAQPRTYEFSVLVSF